MKKFNRLTSIFVKPIVLMLFFLPASLRAQSKCSAPMSQSDFNQYLDAIKSESFTSSQMEVAKQAIQCLNTSQIRSVMEFFSFENSKLEYAKFAYPFCTDQKNYFQLRSALTFSGSKTELGDFVKKQPPPTETTTKQDPIQNPEPEVAPTRVVQVPKTVPDTRPKTKVQQPVKVQDDYNDVFKKAQEEMNAFFVMTLGMGENTIDNPSDVHKPESDEELPAKAPRVVITQPELTQENNFKATTREKKTTVKGVISSSVGIYEVFINDNEAILNPNGEFFGEVLLSPGENNVAIRAKDTKGQNSAISFKIVRETGGQTQEPPKKETVKEDPPVPVTPPVPAPETIFVSEVDKDIPKFNKTNKDAIAVVIGNQKYLKTKSVDFAVNDARSVKNYLVQMLGFKEGNILYYENATLGDMNTIFGTKGNPKGRLFNTIKQGVSDVVIFYSGHGAPGLKSSKAYFVPVEADPNYMENGGYELDILYDNLKAIPAKSITFFSDACFSGANVFDKISPMVIRSKEPVKAGLKNTTLINSCTGTEVSCWHNEEKHGLFTFYLLKALKNYQETDLNKDKQVSLDELFKSLADNNEGVPYYARRQYGLSQTPVLQGPKTRILFKY